ncbi:hypothetical protein BCR43DRAFT_483832 [Syncephalastrum racemosum]|uniref:PB1 domain-containing protein n=1 Tax=Syncephalastrum racemosum TaxID=13706 RepID=A0A1X2HW20_SYNRA|nr:hypothetical protein BCR43DRAFT_483832 [Syncephalastrum racemosum]
MSSDITFKVTFGEVTRRFTLDSQKADWNSLRSALQTAFGFDDNDLVLYYRDNDGDLITLSSNLELSELLHQPEATSIVRLYSESRDAMEWVFAPETVNDGEHQHNDTGVAAAVDTSATSPVAGPAIDTTTTGPAVHNVNLVDVSGPTYANTFERFGQLMDRYGRLVHSDTMVMRTMSHTSSAILSGQPIDLEPLEDWLRQLDDAAGPSSLYPTHDDWLTPPPETELPRYEDSQASAPTSPVNEKHPRARGLDRHSSLNLHDRPFRHHHPHRADHGGRGGRSSGHGGHGPGGFMPPPPPPPPMSLYPRPSFGGGTVWNKFFKSFGWSSSPHDFPQAGAPPLSPRYYSPPLPNHHLHHHHAPPPPPPPPFAFAPPPPPPPMPPMAPLPPMGRPDGGQHQYKHHCRRNLDGFREQRRELRDQHRQLKREMRRLRKADRRERRQARRKGKGKRAAAKEDGYTSASSSTSTASSTSTSSSSSDDTSSHGHHSGGARHGGHHHHHNHSQHCRGMDDLSNDLANHVYAMHLGKPGRQGQGNGHHSHDEIKDRKKE